MTDSYTFKRHRRLRTSEAVRALVRETSLSADDFIYPLFIVEGENIKNEVKSMPNIYQLSLDQLESEIKQIHSLGIRAVLLFGIPKHKDSYGSEAYATDGIIQQAIKLIKQIVPDMLVIADNCLCEYTSHGHCGVMVDGKIENDQSIELMGKTAVTQAEAGADIIAPSSMLDGKVAKIRTMLDEAGYEYVPIMSYAVKFASSFYGPFRDAANSTPEYGDRKTYQMDLPNRKEALREAIADINEGADCIIVKPALSYLDIVREVSETTKLPILTYNVSGEYSMVKAASAKGWINEKEIVLEKLLAMKRAGAQRIITYHAKDVAKWLEKNNGEVL